VNTRLACDFCTTGAPAAVNYPAADFPLAVIGDDQQVWSRGPWAACQPCHALIEQDRWDRLAARAFGPPDLLAQVWAGFRAHRRGPAVPLAAPDTGRGRWTQ
jgi:hypothetical protein